MRYQIPADALPVGSVISFAADDTTDLPPGWALCNGAQHNVASSPDLFQAIGYSNGGASDIFYLPDLRGQFLRGSDAAYKAGQVISPKTYNPGFTCAVRSIPKGYHYTNRGSLIGEHFRKYNAGSVDFIVQGGNSETRPINVYLHFIIKVTLGSSIPCGSVIPFAGSDGQAPGNPLWLSCNGNQYKTAQYKALANVIKQRFSRSGGTTGSLGVPLMSGLFVRGVDAGASRDPDANIRLPAPDGTKGSVVGTVQFYGTSSAGFKVSIPHFPNLGKHKVDSILGERCMSDNGNEKYQSWSGGDSETRPKNAAVSYWINSYPGTTSDNFPIGGIVAIPGGQQSNATLPNSSYWLLCDGKPVSVAQYPDLADQMKYEDSSLGKSIYCWGSPAPDSFNLPDFRGRCLRAADLTAQSATDLQGDPDRFKRQPCNPGGSSFGTGSVQSFATGMPLSRGFYLDGIDHPSGVKTTAATAIGDMTSQFNGRSPQSFSVTGGDDETIPTCVAVQFYIKCADAG